MKFPRYESYRDSGVEWIGEIPSDWDLFPIRAIFHERQERNIGPKTDFILSVMKDRGVIPYDEKGNVGNKKSENIQNYKVVYPGDLVINKMNAIIGSLGISDYHGALSQVYIILFPKDHARNDHRYLGYLFKVKPFQTSLIKIGKGIMVLRESIEFDEFKKLPLPLPTLKEQDRIANFLDQKTAEIDEAIDKKQRLIELLKEQKAILINQAVTKGLNPDVTMRDSGVEWIGEVPAHWEVIRLKHLFREVTNRTKSGEEELLSLRMYAGLVPHNDVSDKPITDAELIDYKLVVPGQMVMNRMRASIGLFGVAKSTGLVSPDYAVFDVDTNIDAGYYLAIFKTSVMGGVFRLNSKGLGTGSSGFMRLYTDNFGRIKVPLPPKEEQQEICIHIESLNEEFEAAETRVASEIDLLNEMRATLISYAVTGKIKI